MIQSAARNQHVPSVVVGIGSDIPAAPQGARFRQKFGIQGPFAVYVGRIDANKGCQDLFDAFTTYLRDESGRLSLVLIGKSLLPVPESPRIRHLGFLDDEDKFDAIAAAELLVIPSYYESLSMVALEAWALGRPVVANGRCDVLKGQCLRSNAGLYYETPAELVETLRSLERTRWLSATLGRNGRTFYREHYDWKVIEGKYLDMLRRLSSEPPTRALEALPGWLERRRPTCPPAGEVVAGLPKGPAMRSAPQTVAAPEARDRRPARPAPPPRRGERRRGSGTSARPGGAAR
jgi:glycosyltransferase involved in cell wall biosynthesis